MSEGSQVSKVTICVQYSKVAVSESPRVGIELPGQLKIDIVPWAWRGCVSENLSLKMSL